MRRILIDWLVDVHLNFKLQSETLFMTVNLIDRYTQAVWVSKGEFQLVGVACMFIASKYEEIYPPCMKDFRYVTDNAFTIERIKQAELHIL